MQEMVAHKNGFQPQGCNFTIPGSAITAGGGSQMGNISPFALKFNRTIVAGSSNTVSVGGFITGGGHGILSGKYGLGADNVLQIELVTADGDIVTANECQNQDLFWAMRGVCRLFIPKNMKIQEANHFLCRAAAQRSAS